MGSMKQILKITLNKLLYAFLLKLHSGLSLYVANISNLFMWNLNSVISRNPSVELLVKTAPKLDFDTSKCNFSEGSFLLISK